MEPHPDFLWQNISQLPYFRGLLRAVEARFYQGMVLAEPVLDLGCGDGHFASIAFEKSLTCGIDPWRRQLLEAKGRSRYLSLINGEGAFLPFQSNSFQTVISNSVLEHIPAVEPVLMEVNRVLKRGGGFIFCVPNHRFNDSLSVAAFFARLGLTSLSKGYQRFFTAISRHHHCDDPAVWTERVSRAGFRLERYFHYFSKKAFHALEWGHYFGLPSLIWKKLLNRWILSPSRWNLSAVEKITRKFYREGEMPEEGVYTFFIAMKL